MVYNTSEGQEEAHTNRSGIYEGGYSQAVNKEAHIALHLRNMTVQERRHRRMQI
jgi:hypothetical protein